ncbi:hypothetical protein [Paenibacillus sp. LjRoot56]|uniref:hypothetical protein n=1 Tax=Paenibacillus sp. LjRoot56 TaxID=3342333 RepID=UPI003ECCB519
MKSLFLNQAIENINTINWMNNHERTEEECKMDVLFVKEFFKRLSLFLDFLSVESKYPYIDPVKLINKESKIDYDKVFELCPNLIKAPNGVTQALCVNHVIWSSLADEGDPIAIQFIDLFKPLIDLFNGGGSWRTHHGMLDIGNKFLCFLSDWKEYKTIELS